jgi:hypothetical protein
VNMQLQRRRTLTEYALWTGPIPSCIYCPQVTPVLLLLLLLLLA